MNEKYFINTVKNAMQLLHLFTENSPEWSLTELANEKSLNISLTKRLVHTLTEYGYLDKNPISKKYRLGLSIVKLSGVITTTMEIYNEARPVLSNLMEKYDVDVHIGVLEDIEVVYLDKFDSPYSPSLKASSHIGKRNPSYCTGCGKVLLAFKSQSLQQDLLTKISKHGFEKFASKTVQTVDNLKHDLEKIQQNGYAVSTDELLEGVTSISVPIFDFSEDVIAAISLTGPSSKVTVDSCLDDLVHTSVLISNKLGYVKLN